MRRATAKTEPQTAEQVAGVSLGEEERDEQFGGPLRAFLFAVLGHPEGCEEVVQETLLFLWEHRHERRPVSHLQAWAFKVARFKALSWRRDRACRHGVYFSDDTLVEVAADFTMMGQTYSGWARGDFFENLAVFPDLDGDGLPDDWELAWSPSLEAADPDGDVSGDGFANLEVFIPGLNRLVPGRVKQAMEEEGFVFNPPAAEGAGYEGLSCEFEVLFSTDLVDWEVVHAGTADGEEWVIEQPPETLRGFFRLNVFIR